MAAACVIEAKPLALNQALEREVASRLLEMYEQALRERRFSDREQIEDVLQRWLLSLPKEINRLPVLAVLREAITRACQRAALTMLALIAQSLVDCPSAVFETLIPPLLALANLPAISPYQPTPDIALSSSLDVIDLALTILFFLGKPGPSGLFLQEVRQYFKDKPQHLYLLARYSLECGTLLTPTVVPLAQENYQRYERAIGQCIALRDALQKARISPQAIETCGTIQQNLLDCAEEVTYPAAQHLLNMLDLSVTHADQSWQETCKNYLER